MTDSALDAAEKRAHEAVDRIEPIYSSAKRWHVGTRDAHAAIRDLRQEAYRAGLERAATVAKGWSCLDANDVMASFDSLVKKIRALAEDADE